MKVVLLSTFIACGIAIVALLSVKGVGTPLQVPANNVSIVDGVQVVEIRAHGGYWPKKSVARAGLPTILRFNTRNVFDCSSSVRIPSMDISKTLPQSGTTDISVGLQATSTLVGSCGMGMYPFEVSFE